MEIFRFHKTLIPEDWRGGRVAESTGLLNLHTGNRITSSNLVLSAEIPYRALCEGFFVSSVLEMSPGKGQEQGVTLRRNFHMCWRPSFRDLFFLNNTTYYAEPRLLIHEYSDAN